MSPTGGTFLANNSISLPRPGIVARYFLRRLAMAYRSKPARAPFAQYSNAMAATIFVFVMTPTLGLAGIFLILSLRWTALSTAESFGSWPKIGMYSLVPISMLFGYMLLAKGLKQFSPLYNRFDSAQDRKIARWLEFGAVAMVAAVFPFLGLLVAFGF
jgi:hypothetical protein